MTEYAHMCRDGHEEIGYDGPGHDLCPLCHLIGKIEKLEEERFESHMTTCMRCMNGYTSCREYPWEKVRTYLYEHRRWVLRTIVKDPLFIPEDERGAMGCDCGYGPHCEVKHE